MAAGNYDLHIEQGANFELEVFIRDSNGSGQDLTGHTFRGKIKRKFEDVASVVDFTFSVLDQSQESTRGRLRINLTALQTSGISLGAKGITRADVQMIYDIESVNGTGVVKRWLQGSAFISPEVTT